MGSSTGCGHSTFLRDEVVHHAAFGQAWPVQPARGHDVFEAPEISGMSSLAAGLFGHP
jgi:hypothetical protein